MSFTSRSLGRAAARPSAASFEFGGRHALALVLAASAALGGVISLRLESVLARYDTLAYLLAASSSEKLSLLRGILAIGGALQMIFALVAWRSARAAAALCGITAAVTGALSGPLARAWFAPEQGFEESLLYRLRGLAATGVLGGLFLLFLAALPAILAAPAGPRETKWTRRLGHLVEKLIALPPLGRRIGIATLAFTAAMTVGLGILADFPNSSDESSYLTQARIYAAGRLWVEAPPHPEFFRARSFVMDEETGRFFAKAFPGWAAILAVGVKAGAPWIVNPILSALTVILLGWVGAEILGPRGELVVLGMVLVSPFFLLNSGSYFNHPAALLFVTLFLAAVLRLQRGGGAAWAAAAGTAAGAVLAIRPVAAVALTLPFLLWKAIGWLRERRWRMLAGSALPLMAILAALGAYDQVMYGSPWKTGYGAYDPSDIRMGLGPDNFLITLWWLFKLCLWTIPGSLAGLYFLGRGRRPGDWLRREPVVVLMGVSLLLLGIAYLVLQNKGGNEYGPRYYYDGLTYLALLMTAGWMRAPRLLEGRLSLAGARRGTALVLGFGGLLAVLGSTPFLLAHYRDKVAHNRDLYARLEQSGFSTALVFLETGSGRMPPGDLVRNPLDFRSGIVYARDRGERADRMLAALYPDRPALVYAYDPTRRRSTLRALGEAPHP